MSKVTQLRRSLTRGEWLSLGGIAFDGARTPRHRLVHPAGDRRAAALPVGNGTGLRRRPRVTAYTLGMRHAFDADHIAAIDNTTRKLMADGKRPLSVGFWFSLGHSSIVFGLRCCCRSASASLAGQVENDASTLHADHRARSAPPSPACSSSHRHPQPDRPRRIIRVFRAMRRGDYDEAALEEHLNNRGFMNRILGGATESVTKPLAHVPGRLAVRARLRHRDRGQRCWCSRAAPPRSPCPGTPS